MRLLLFSNSTNVGEDYLQFTLPYIKDFIPSEGRKALFIPFAAVSITYDSYFQIVESKLKTIGLELNSIHKTSNMVRSIETAEIIIIGGGNTFALLKKLQDLTLIDLIRSKVIEESLYIGWSAGSNLACPTIKTTNDMPIVQPDNFSGLNLVPFQINPHYTDLSINGHGGETREMRINEFIIANPESWVVGLKEGTLLELKNNHLCLKGNDYCKVFKSGNKPKEYFPNEDLNFLMQ